MALFLVSVKRRAIVNNVQLEPGMSVQIPTTGYNPLTTNGGRDVVNAFMRIYGIDVSRACNFSYFDVERIG